MTGESPTVPDVSSAGTPRRSVRVPDETWLPAVRKAARRGEYLADVIRAALEAYVAEDDEPGDRQPDDEQAD